MEASLESYYSAEEDKDRQELIRRISFMEPHELITIIRAMLAKEPNSTVRDVVESKTDIMFECNRRTYVCDVDDFDGSPIFKEIGSRKRVELNLDEPVTWLF
jgi:hypothetical protein